MACLDEDAITDLLAGRLHLSDATVEQHLAACSACARLLGAATATVDDNPAATTAIAPAPAPTTETVVPPSRRSRRHGDALAPQTLLTETYVVHRLIGRGGMGEVYEASHVRLSGRYAIKVLRAEISDDEELVARFRREAENHLGFAPPQASCKWWTSTARATAAPT